MSLNGSTESGGEIMRVGIFGGTFDPPHLGHMILAAEAAHQLNLDRLLWVLASDPPHKQRKAVSTLEARLAMVAACVQEDAQFELSRVDIDRPGPHYAVDMVALLAEQFPEAELIFLVGGDSIRELPTWGRAQRFVDSCDGIGVMRRPGEPVALDELEVQLPGLTQKVSFIDAPLLEIASSEIRDRITRGYPYRYYLLPAVYDLIERNGYYTGGA
jgi:nicotinate-nucleotide adenylyltransferase